MIDQEQEPAEEPEITITAIIEEINRSISWKNSSMHEDIQVDPEENNTESTVTVEMKNRETEADKLNNESSGPSTSERLQNSLLGEQTSIQRTSRVETSAGHQLGPNIISIMDEAMLQDSNSNDVNIPGEEFSFISDPDSLEDIVIYDMVVEYQAAVTVKRA